MSQQPSGWYDDPSNADMLRYWDGVTWTNHTAPKKSPTASQSTIGLPQQSQQGHYGQVPPDRTGVPTPTTPMPQGSGWQSQSQAPQQQAQGHYPQAPANAQWMHNIRTTADGVPLASWGKRVGAWLIDGVILYVINLFVLSGPSQRLNELLTQFQAAMTARDSTAIDALTGPIVRQALLMGLLVFLVASIYAIAFWTTTAQTPGKMALRISVRRASEPGPLPVSVAIRRRAVPLLGVVVPLLSLFDGLWPLWDDKRQALHDKVASTQVVEGKQPRKQV